MTNITKAAQTSAEPWSFWEALPGHLIDKYEGATLTEELLQEAAASLHAKLRAEQPARQEPCSGPLCGLPEFGEHHPLCNLHLRAALQDKAVEVTVAIDNLYNERRDGMTNAIFPPVQIGTRLSAAQPAPVVPDDHPLMVFAKECRLGAYTGREVIQEAGKALAASQQKGSAG